MSKANRSGARKGLRNLILLSSAFLLTTSVVLTMAVDWEGGPSSRPLPNRFSQAKVAYADGDFERAETILRSLGPATPSQKAFLAKVLIERGRLKEAGGLYSALLKETPEDFEATLGLGIVYERLRNFRQAVRQFKRAGELRPHDARSWRRLAMAQYRGGDSMGALFSLRTSLRHLPGQEDLSQLMNEIGTARNRQSLAGARSRPGGRDPFDPFGRQNRGRFGPTPPTPGIPDPLQGLPIPGRRQR